MKPPLRIVDTGLRAARWNVAMTAALTELHAKGAIADMVRFHRYPACVLLGRSQVADAAADVAYCRSAGIELARRTTGGGAVFMSPRMLAWDVVVDRGAGGGGLTAVTRRICEGVALGLCRLGAVARFRPPNDIAIGGCKVSGSGGYAEGRSAVLQGTVLVVDEIADMARVLRIPEPTLRRKVTSLADTPAGAAPLASIVECISRGLAETMQRQPAVEPPNAEELALCETLLRQDIGSEAFVSQAKAAAAGVAI